MPSFGGNDVVAVLLVWMAAMTLELGSLCRGDICVKSMEVDVDRQSGISYIHVPNSEEIVLI